MKPRITSYWEKVQGKIMSFELILSAAKYLEYRDEMKARGETPCSFIEFDERKIAFSHEDEQCNEGLQPSTDSHSANGIGPNSAMLDVIKNAVNGKSVDINKKNSNSGLITREAHNRLEKNRRAQMKECFESVKRLLPSISNQKVSNVVVLKTLRREVNSVKKQYEKLATEKRMLKQKNDSLRSRVLQLKYDVPNHEIWTKYNIELGNDGESTTTASEVGSTDETGELCFSSLPGDESTRSSDETEKSHMMNASRPSVLINPKGEKWNLQTGSFNEHCERGSPILFASLTGSSVGSNVPKTNTSINSLLVQSPPNSNQLIGTSSSIHHSTTSGSLENTSRHGHVCVKYKEYKTSEVDQRYDGGMSSFDSTPNLFRALRIDANSLDDAPGTLANTSQASLAVNIQNKVLDSNVSLQTNAFSDNASNMENLVSVCQSELSLLKKTPVNVSLPSLPHSFSTPNKTVVQHAHKVISKNGISNKVFVALPANNMLLKTEQKAMSAMSYNGNQYISAGVPLAKEPSQSGAQKVLLISTSSMAQNREHSSNLANHAKSLLTLSSPKAIIKQNSPQLSNDRLPGDLTKEVAFNTLPEESVKQGKKSFGKGLLYKDLKCVPTAMVLEPMNSMHVTCSAVSADSSLGINLQYNRPSKIPSTLHQSNVSLPVDNVSIHHNYSVVSSSKNRNPDFHRSSEKTSISCPTTVLVKQSSMQDNVLVQLSPTVPQIELLMPSSKHSTHSVSLDPEIKTGMLYCTPPRNSSVHSILKLSPPLKPQASHSKLFTSKDNLVENMSEIVTPQLFLVSVPNNNRPNELCSMDVNACDSDNDL